MAHPDLKAALRSSTHRAVDAVRRLAPAGLIAALPPSLKTRLKSMLFGDVRGVLGLDQRLWGGFSHTAHAALVTITEDADRHAFERGEAAFALSRWAAFAGAFEQALAWLDHWAARNPRALHDPRLQMLRVLYLERLGRVPEAAAALASLGNRSGVDATTRRLLAANIRNPALGGAGASDAAVLGHLNAIFSDHGLAPIAKADPAAALSLDNLTCHANSAAGPQARVSVIMPVHNGAATVETALRSLSAQSWPDLEVIIVDDASTDDTRDRIASFCRADPRFTWIGREENGGSYAARNAGLAQATGQFITILDADDWAHPERIAVQAQRMLDTGAPHTVAPWARCSTDLLFWGPWRPTATLLGYNMGSHMIRRDLIERAGGWSTARISADSELIRRVGRHVGQDRPTAFPALCPLVLGRVDPASLTQHSATHLASFLHGVRREYLEAAARYPSRPAGVASPPPERAIPATIRSRQAAHVCDLLVIADWNNEDSDGAAWSALREGRARALRVAAFQYSDYGRALPVALLGAVRDTLSDEEIAMIAPGESCGAQTVLLACPALFAYPLDRFPTIACRRLVALSPAQEVAAQERALAGIQSKFGALPEVIACLDALFT